MASVSSDHLDRELSGPIRAECQSVDAGSFRLTDKTWYARPMAVVVWLRTGQACHLLDVQPPTRLTQTAGDIICYPPGTRHRLDSLSGPGGTYTAVFLTFETASGADPMSFFEIPYLFRRPWPATDEIREAVTRLAALEIAPGHGPGVRIGSMRDMCAVLEQREMALRILRALLSQARFKSPCPAYADHTRVAPAIGYIYNRFASPLPIGMLAGLTHMSRAQFYVSFRNATGQSPGAYIRRLRLAKAAKMLVETDLKTAVICDETGFSDPFHFSRVFRKEFGLPPSAYRREHSVLVRPDR